MKNSLRYTKLLTGRQTNFWKHFFRGPCDQTNDKIASIISNCTRVESF